MQRRSWRFNAGRGALIGVVLGFAAVHAWGQEPPARPPLAGPRTTLAEGTPTLLDSGPPITAYPAELLQLLAPPAERGPITLRPSITVSEEFTDNVVSAVSAASGTSSRAWTRG